MLNAPCGFYTSTSTRFDPTGLAATGITAKHRRTSTRSHAKAHALKIYYTPDAPCLPSRTAMYSGRFPKHLDDEALIARHNKMVGPHCSLEISMYDDKTSPHCPRHPGKVNDLKSMRKIVDGYDTAIRYVDDRVGKMVQMLKDAGIYDDTAIIISADHGENFGELGIYAEHATADVGTCRIPMIIKWPKMKGGVVDDGLRYNVDLAPTLMQMLGREPCPIWDGQSYAETLQGGNAEKRDQIVISQCAETRRRKSLTP